MTNLVNRWGVSVLALLVFVVIPIPVAASTARIHTPSSIAYIVIGPGVSLAEWSAIGVALAAVAVAILVPLFEARRAKKHAMLSVRPCVDLHWYGKQGQFKIFNSGLGPAILKSLMVGTPSVPLAQVSNSQWNLVCADFQLAEIESMMVSENEEYTIAPGGEKTLFTVLGWGACNASLILNNLQV